ncbi:uncharacterized protein LOC143068607 isoform X2 [Mytilus galloprovincialis]|uniref:uncharacterized protein LOC143068607 isoform X2 n=1 Tax=Mytilus galloprovincialis TaxID=29158 RepID=UPI003F7B9271
MVDRYGRSPDIYLPFPIDHERIGTQRREKLQREIEKMEQDQRQRQHLIEELSKMAETKKQNQQDRLLVKYNKKNLLSDEMMRVYGKETASKIGRMSVEPKLVNNVVSQRTKEYAVRQQEMEMEAKYLVKERQRLQDARERVHEQRRFLAKSSSPSASVMSEPDNMHRTEPEVQDTSRLSLHTPTFNIDTYIKNTVNTLPQTMDRITRLREDVQKHYNKYKKPYKGEMGIHTYQPFQMQGYFAVRSIVDDVVNDFLDRHVAPSQPMVEQETYYASRRQKIHETEIMAETLSEKKAIQLIMEEIILDETGDILEEIVQEHVHTKGTVRNWADEMAMNRAESGALDNEEGRTESDPAYNSVTKLFFSVKHRRDETRPDIWGHTQMLGLAEKPSTPRKVKPPPPKGKDKKSKQKTPSLPPKSRERSKPPTRQTVPGTAVSSLPADPTTPILHYHHITPVDIRNYHVLRTDVPEVKYEKTKYIKYMRREMTYWQKMIPVISEKSLAKRCKGIACCSASPNGKFIVFGTVHGDCIIFFTQSNPWRPVRVIVNDSSKDDPIVNISWSLDSSRLITINRSGSLQVWAYSGADTVQSDAKKIGISSDENNVAPPHLDILIGMDMGHGDFVFQQGPHAKQQTIDGNYGPAMATFFPTFTFFGDQSQTCIAIGNGDILKSDFDVPLNAPPDKADYEYEPAPVILNPIIKDSNTKGNRIGNGLDAELLRYHQTKVIFLGFYNNINDLITMDDKGYIAIWKYDVKQIEGVGWIVPYKKYQLSPYKLLYDPVDDKQPKLVFTDKTVPGQRPRTRQEIAQQREMMANTIDNMMLGDPWDIELLENRTIRSSTYIPSGKIKESGAIFHIVMRHVEDNTLSSYVTRAYKPLEVEYTKLIGAKQTVKGDAMVIGMLFKSYPPKEPHLTLVIFDYNTMELRDFRRDVYLSEGEYSELLKDDNKVSFDVSRVFGPTGSEHLFLLVRGVLRVISLTTGRQMVKQEEVTGRFTNFQGCVIDFEHLELPTNAEVTAVSTANHLFAVFYDDKTTTYHIVKFEDENTDEDRRDMWETYSKIVRHRTVPVELRVDTYTHKGLHHGEDESDDIQHPAVMLRSIILETMDNALQASVKKKYSPKMKEGLQIYDKIKNYEMLETLVEDEKLL